MELMPAWKRWGYEEGMEEGIEKGIEQGIEQGIEKGIEKGIERGKEEERQMIIRKFLDKGFSPEEVANTMEMPIDDVRRLMKQ